MAWLGSLCLSWTAPVCAQEAVPAEPTFSLGVVEISGARPADGSTVSSTTMTRNDTQNAGEALALVPGVALSRVGARNELMVQVRGFDLRQTPIFVDGIPVYVPYDGYVDLGRFNTFDLSRIQVEKGWSSMLYGANTLGGAINLVGRRPSRPIEFEAGTGVTLDRQAQRFDDHWGYANLGLRGEQWYAQAGVSELNQDEFQLPSSFTPTKAEDGGARDNSYARDRKLSLKVGWTPNAEDEYAVNIIDQHGVKGTPPYAGNVASVTPRYWRWPYWDKQSVYGVSRTAIGEHVLKLRLFHDTFRNSLFTYDDATYTTQKKASSFQSWYDDYSQGGSGQLDLKLSQANTLGMAAHWKEDVHREHNAGEPERTFKDHTLSFAAEDTHRIVPGSTLIFGVGQDRRQALKAEDYNSTTKAVSEFKHASDSTTNVQVALRQALGQGWNGQLSLARKSRFPTLKDRYSYRLGTALPHPDLAPERATHIELRADGPVTPWLNLQATVFRSRITDLMQSVTTTTMCGTSACTQMQNIGQARSQGVELGGQARWGAWQLDGQYQFLDRDNLSNPAVKLTDTPRHQGRVQLGWRATPTVAIYSQVFGASGRYSSSDGLQVAGKFCIVNLKSTWQVSPQIALEASVLNLGDRQYAYSEGYPEPGREWKLQARMNW